LIETWGFYFFTNGHVNSPDDPPSPEAVQETYDRYMKLWVDCEDYGFDGLSFAEHHFSPISFSPSAHLLVAALAPQTHRMRLTVLGSVLPLHDSRQWVEEVGMLDYLSGGRFEPGIAPGAGDREAVMAGLSPEQIRPRYYSGAELLAKAIAGPTVTQHDEFYDLEQVPIVPRMRERTGRSTWTTVMSPNSAAWAGTRGYKLCTAFVPTPAAVALAERYREAAYAAGHTVTPTMLGMRRRVFVADTDAEAQEKYEQATDYMGALLGKAFETPDSRARAMLYQPDDFAIGSPTTVADKLVEQCRAGGYGAIMAFTDFAGFDHADFVRSHELLGRQVAPVLRSADVATPSPSAA
jgi:alkanesulfonate monooxygenase SsuD/methylene tetrahydromethanopterin reductase-like flavin-dependent oxidoreductase (luciferase family)